MKIAGRRTLDVGRNALRPTSHIQRPTVDVRFERPAGVSAAWVQKVVSSTLKRERSSLSLNILITGDGQIRRINKKYLRHDTATDVVSFSTGDIVVSRDTARRVASKLGLPFREELARYLVHGTLHLLGYDDKKKKDRKVMFAKQEGMLVSLRRSL